ncbi:unnamed protein product [Sphagnum balticum]
MKISNLKALPVVALLFTANPSWSDDTATTMHPNRAANAQDASKNGIANGESDYLGDATQGGITRWPQSRMPIRVFIKTGTDVQGYRPNFEPMLRQAFEDWVDAGKGKIKFQYVPQIGDAQLICTWTSNPKEMISSAEGGHAMVVPDNEGILNTTLSLLTVDQSTGVPISDNIARRVDLHEIGHALGLLGHSRTPGDVMYGTYLPTDSIPSLTERDKNTIVALYSLDDATVRFHPIGSGEGMIAGDSTSLVVRAAKANQDAVDAMKNKNFPLAVQKLEEAHKLDPANDLYTGNLGLAYGNIAAMALMLGNVPQANAYFQKSIPMAEKCPSKANVIAILKNYCTLLHSTKRDAEAGKYEAKIKQLSGQ